MPPTIVIDPGSGTFRAGFAAEHSPRVEFPTIVFRQKVKSIIVGQPGPIEWVGYDAEANYYPSIPGMKHPIKRGKIEDWETLETILRFAFYKALETPPETVPVLLTESPNTTIEDRIVTVEKMFEVYCVPSLCIQNTAMLSLFATGKTNGLVIESGDETTCVTPVVNGHSLEHATVKSNFGGKDVTDALVSLLDKNNVTLYGHSLRNFDRLPSFVKTIKEKFCYVALDIESENANQSSSYLLPDGTTLTLGKEKWTCAELIFHRLEHQHTFTGIIANILSSVSLCDSSLHSLLMENIIIAGGNTLFEGFVSRVENELKQQLPFNTKINITAPSNRKNLAWIGGSLFASHSNFASQCITDKEYEEYGTSIVNKKKLY